MNIFKWLKDEEKKNCCDDISKMLMINWNKDLSS